LDGTHTGLACRTCNFDTNSCWLYIGKFSFKKSTTRLSGMNFSLSSGTSPNTNDKFVRIENELATMKIQMQALLAYIAFKEDVPEYLASIATSLQRPSVIEV